jgi:Fe2+ transport system protein FeoA
MRVLAGQSPGTKWCVVRVEGADPIAQRLMEMGFVRGAQIEIVRFAPLGDPMQISVLGYQLSLRRSEARRIAVEP